MLDLKLIKRNVERKFRSNETTQQSCLSIPEEIGALQLHTSAAVVLTSCILSSTPAAIQTKAFQSSRDSQTHARRNSNFAPFMAAILHAPLSIVRSSLEQGNRRATRQCA